MPNKNTFEIKPIRKFIDEEMCEGLWIDPYANRNRIANITNDLNEEYDTDYHRHIPTPEGVGLSLMLPSEHSGV